MSARDGADMRPAWIEVDSAAVRQNAAAIIKKADGAAVMGVVKGGAYGHGMARFARLLLESGIGRLAVSTLDEGLELRREGIKCPLMVLGALGPEQIIPAIEADIIQTVFSAETASRVSRAAVGLNKTAAVHIKIDTGMGRIGFLPDGRAKEEIGRVLRLPNLCAEGIFSHFAAADTDREYSLAQISAFDSFCAGLRAAGIEFKLRHMCNSAGMLRFENAYYDMVRPGLLLYGCYPCGGAEESGLCVSPALSVKARLTMVKTLPKGSSVGYGRCGKTRRDTVIGTLPLGYADGLPYAYARGGAALIGGRRAPIIGSVCMDQTMIDLTDCGKAAAGDEVIIIGRSGEDSIAAGEIAGICGTISYEILTNLNARLGTVYV